jgi:hypothetical protein
MEAVVRPRRIVRSSVAKYSDKPMTATKKSKINQQESEAD